jgi:hypothetical protein
LILIHHRDIVLILNKKFQTARTSKGESVKKQLKKLAINRETIASPNELNGVGGGASGSGVGSAYTNCHTFEYKGCGDPPPPV